MKRITERLRDRYATMRSQEYHSSDMAMAKSIARAISKAQGQVAADIETLLKGFQYRGGFDTKAEAEKFLLKPLTDRMRTVLANLIKKAPDSRQKRIAIERMSKESTLYAMNVKKALQTVLEVNEEVIQSAIEADAEPFLYKQVDESYGRESFEITKDVGIAFDVALPPVSVASKIVRSEVKQSKVLSENVVARAEEQVMSGVLAGKTAEQISKEVADGTDADFWQVKRLVRTMKTDAAAKADLEALKDAEYDEYQFVASLDEKTCPICGRADGKVHKIGKEQRGIDFPPMHPNCRCVIVAPLDEMFKDTTRLARDSQGNWVEIPQSWTYEDWAKAYYPKGYDLMQKGLDAYIPPEPDEPSEADEIREEEPFEFPEPKPLGKYTEVDAAREFVKYYRSKSNNGKLDYNIATVLNAICILFPDQRERYWSLYVRVYPHRQFDSGLPDEIWDSMEGPEPTGAELKEEFKDLFEVALRITKADDEAKKRQKEEEKRRQEEEKRALEEKKAKERAEREAAPNVMSDEEIRRKMYPDELGGVKRGDLMTFDKADGSRPNVRFNLPNGPADGYWTNCQTCVITFIARLRGYDVQAKPCTSRTHEWLAGRPERAYIDPKTGEIPLTERFEVKNNKELYKAMSDVMVEGAYYSFQVLWKSKKNQGHIIIAYKDKTGVRLYDPQQGKSFDPEEGQTVEDAFYDYTKGARMSGGLLAPSILRIDNLPFNTDVVNNILEPISEVTQEEWAESEQRKKHGLSRAIIK